ncbi:uncharacterized protein LOC142985892 [Anticarsia gemmatalis]|uniref:uncharacterized protein LOC142985892 n=1 Tax=Anticarsia gemmatalis TaxID=129554 RepID=UPI003F75B676
MSLKVLVEGEILNVIAAYAPQVGCSKQKKDTFWTLLESQLQKFPSKETTILGGDLNGHIGKTNAAFKRVHGGHGFGTPNDEGKVIMSTAAAFDLAIVNSFFAKKTEHKITYKSGHTQSQIDYILVNREHIGRVKNCKVIPGECVITQHRLVVMDMLFRKTAKEKPLQTPELTKWWNLKGDKIVEFREHLKDIEVDFDSDVDSIWTQFSKSIMTAAHKTLGRTKGGKKAERETWWWTDEVQKAIQRKKIAFKTWQSTQTPEDKEEYRKAKKDAKRTIAVERAISQKSLYSQLNSKEGQKIIYKLAQQRCRSTKDPGTCKTIKGPNGDLLYKDRDTITAWHQYYQKLLNTNPTVVQLPKMEVNMGLINSICSSEVNNALQKMSNKKAIGPDGLSTTDPMFALSTIAEEYRAKNQPLYVAFLDMEKAFDRVPRDTIWWSLRKKNVPERYVNIIADMYKGAKSNIRTVVGETKSIAVSEGDHQGSVLSPFLFCLILDSLTEEAQNSAAWSFIYADDVAICTNSRDELQRALLSWKHQLQTGGLELSVAKTQFMSLNEPGPNDNSPISIDGQLVAMCDQYKYLGNMMHSSGNLECNIQHRIAAVWLKWREVTGVICDKRMPVKLKGLVYKTIIRPVLMYGSETWAVTQKNVHTIQVAEMKMLRWMCGVTRLDKIGNEYVRGSLGVRDIADKIQENPEDGPKLDGKL